MVFLSITNCVVFLVLLLQRYVGSYKPVVIIHGILDTYASMGDLKAMVEKSHPGSNVTLVKLFPELESINTPMWKQMSGVAAVVKDVMKRSKDGIHLIGFSQGGLVARAVIENCSDHNIENFISLSSPQMGQYGVTSYLSKYIPKISREFLYELLYTETLQRHLSIANYWNDPIHVKAYLQGSVFLPILNNNNNSEFFDKERYISQKKNFAKLKNLVLIGGPDDGVITPWQSALFAFYDKNLNVTTMKDQQAYLQDWFGLGTLGKRNAIHPYVFSNIGHKSWHGTKIVFEKAIEPWLT